MTPPLQSSLPLPPSDAPDDCVFAVTDGAARGNPGPAAYGVIFTDGKGKTLKTLAEKIGKATNNVAEYRALIAALTYANEQGWKALAVKTDSQLMARQIRGEYKVKHADMKPLHAKAKDLIATLDYFRITEDPRSETTEADALANAALDL